MIETMVDATNLDGPADLDTYGGRLAHALKLERLEYRAFAQRLNVTSMGIYKVLKNQSAYLQTPVHFAACRLLKIRPEWLIYGEGPMRPTAEATPTDAIDYRTLALMIVMEHPDADARDLMLALIDKTDTKLDQLRQVAGQRALSHTP